MTKVVTFYSYKGGVGRTMALVNVAHVLARDGWRVLMVDFDLEAPGMTHFFREQVRSRPKTVTKDALDLLLHAKSTINWDPIDKKPKPPELPKSLAEYVVPIPLPDKWKDKVIPYRTGRLDLLPATLDPVEPEEAPEAEPSQNYLQRMDMLDLQGVFDTGGPRHWFGNHVRQYFINARFRTKGDILFTLRDKVWAAYDIVLVDSRTGLNEVAGLCIGPLCDALVICTGLNDQSIYGTKYFMKKSGLFDRDKAKPYTLVAGPVPPWHTHEANERIALIRKELRCETVAEIPYHAAAALIEKTFILDEPKDTIAQAYEGLTPCVASLPRTELDRETGRRTFRITEREVRFPSGSLGLQKQIAQQLSDGRLREVWARFAPTGEGMASFPTVAAVVGVHYARPEDYCELSLGLLPVAAGVSACRLQSDLPFRRAWRIVARACGEYERNRLGVRLLFMQLRTLGTLPRGRAAKSALDYARGEVRGVLEMHGYVDYYPDTIGRHFIDCWMALALQR
ncbi:MAG: ParA family protein [Planctomycetes bacterium]|nr:ParA family protein [Planctomycetota bacterium]